jgi:anti-sigma regulatory factor (Ser/Thr protein kinase)
LFRGYDIRGIHAYESLMYVSVRSTRKVVTTPTVDADTSIPECGQCWRRTFPGRADQAGHVRRFVAFLLADHPCTDDAVQAVAEMAANAIQHTRSAAPGGLFVVEVRRWRGDCVAVSITDQGGPSEPRPAEPDYLAGHGRGLHLIGATASSWSWRGGAAGRTVTAVFTPHTA